MFGWGRKSDGFDWHTHVRTTIKLRREDRRQRILEVRDVAADGLKYAGRASVSAGNNGFVSLWNGALSVIQILVQGAFAGRQTLARVAKQSVEQSVSSARSTAEMWAKKSVGSPLVPTLGVVGLIALHAASTRWRSGSGASTGELLLVVLIALGCLIAATVPLVLGTTRLALPKSWSAYMPRMKLPAVWLGRLSSRQRWGAAIAAGIALTLGAFYIATRTTPTAITSLTSFRPFSAPPIEGRATIVAGDIIRINGTTVRIAGIDAPEAEQKCTGANKKKWPCGEAARNALTRIVKGRKVRCELSGTDDAGRSLGTCDAVGAGAPQNIAAALVKEGAVFSSSGFFSGLNAFEAEAREKKLGVWRGDAERPSEYRAKLWEAAVKAAPEGCPIKGQVSGSDKSYLLPWQAEYSGVRIRTSRGERWFCLEAEAQAAGWKAAGR